MTERPDGEASGTTIVRAACGNIRIRKKATHRAVPETSSHATYKPRKDRFEANLAGDLDA